MSTIKQMLKNIKQTLLHFLICRLPFTSVGTDSTVEFNSHLVNTRNQIPWTTDLLN